jgi:phage baseplate assembly protein V
VYQERHTATVEFKDRGDGLVTKELPVSALLTRKNHAYAMPDEGEHVICAFYGNGLEEGVILGAIYDGKNAPPQQDRDTYYIKFEDDTSLSIDRKKHVVEVRDHYGSYIKFENGNIYIMAKENVYINE